MAAYVALLRAVNLAGKNQIAMADLRGVAQRVGLEQARTLLNSGNLLFETGQRGSAGLEKLLETALARELGLVTPVVVRSLSEWRAAIDANPFPAQAQKEPGKLLLMPLKGKPVASKVAELVRAIVGREQVKAAGSSLYLVYPDGVGRSKLTSALIEKKVGMAGTARNWNTVQKLLAQLETPA